MFKCVVHLYGLPYEITALREVEVDLEEGAGMAAVIAALKGKNSGARRSGLQAR